MGTAAIGATAFAGQFGVGPAAAQPKKGGTFRVGMAGGNTNDNYVQILTLFRTGLTGNILTS